MQLLQPLTPPSARPLLGLALALVPLSACLAAAPYTLVWSDEFDYTGLPDNTKWGYDVGGGGWGNNELQYYTSGRLENARVEDGRLVIEAIKEEFSGRSYTSARLVSKNKGDWLYGRFEIRAKLPYGRGTWPAVWMLPTDWAYGGWPASGEIDIMEHVGYDMQRVHGTIHTADFNHTKGTQIGNSIVSAHVETEFHDYAMEWRPHRIDIFMDGLLYFTVTDNGTGFGAWPFDKRFHLIMNIAVGGNWGGVQGVDTSIWPQRMEIDHVRVYSINDYAYAPAVTVPGIVQMEDFSDHYGIRLESTLDTGGGLNAGYLTDDDWLEFRLQVPVAGRYAVDLRYASPGGNAKVIVGSGTAASSPAGPLPATGGWQTWATATAGELDLPAGESTLRLTIDSPTREDLNLNWLEVRLVEAYGTDYGMFAGYPMTGSWVDSGDFLGWAELSGYPWAYLLALDKYVYAAPSATNSGWLFIPRN